MKKLKNAPLKEVIFEVRWDLDLMPNSEHLYDPGIDLAMGQLKYLIKDDFPDFKRKLPPEVPMHFFNYNAIYQFWKDEGTYPVLQLGPGIFTINDTDDNYVWEENFKPLIKKGLNNLQKAYDTELDFKFANLRYIDMVKTGNYNFNNWESFIKEHFNFSFENKFDSKGNLKQFKFSQLFKQKDDSDLLFTISSGKNNNHEDILIWETSISKKDSLDADQILYWKENAHSFVSQFFKNVCREEFYASFNK